MSKREKKNLPFNVLFGQSDKRKLEELSERLAISQGLLLRQLVCAAYAHTIEGLPVCASGKPCQVPQLHQKPQP